jgi:hypothetical protein
VRCCAGFFEGGAKYGACDMSSCRENFGAKNRNCFNYGSPEHPLTVEDGNPSGPTDDDLGGPGGYPDSEPEVAGKAGGSAICPYYKYDKAICDTSYYTDLNGGSVCRSNDNGGLVHCLGKVKCGSSGVLYSNGVNAHSIGADADGPCDYATDPSCTPCASTEYPGGTDCFYDGTSENWKVCKGSVSTVFGDPHILSWTGEYFDYMGQCDLVLVENEEFNQNQGFTVHIRAKTRYDFSYIESAAVMIGDDILEVGSYGDFFLNSVQGAQELTDGLATVGGYPVEYEMKNKKTHMFYIRMGKAGTVEIKTYKEIVSIKFDGMQGYAFGNSKGLMGDFYTGAHLSRDGKTVMEKEDDFGQEWQVDLTKEPLLFDSPPPKGKCQLPKIPYGAKAQQARRLGEQEVSLEDAEKACAHLPEGQGHEQCVYDVLATNDLGAAEAGVF